LRKIGDLPILVRTFLSNELVQLRYDAYGSTCFSNEPELMSSGVIWVSQNNSDVLNVAKPPYTDTGYILVQLIVLLVLFVRLSQAIDV
jgi:hypothetical protein